MPSFRLRPARSLATAALLGLSILLTIVLAPRRAEAYPWMIRHEYTGCSVCHGDPMGGGVLTQYGRAQGDLLMSSHYGKRTEEEAAEPSRFSGFLFGAWKEPPEWLLAGGDFRLAYLVNKVGSGANSPPLDKRFVHMQSDLRLMIRPSIFRAGASLGYIYEGALPALVTRNDNSGSVKGNLVSREHWLGVALKEDAILIRAGRMNLPFGLRNVDHTLWARKATGTDINTSQQHGLAVAYVGDNLRGEVMGILGNFQVSPDAYRQRGAAGFVEYAFASKYAVGLSGLYTTALLDATTRTTLGRGAFGIFGRASPKEPIVLSTEIDAILKAPASQKVSAGVVGFLQADYQPIQGVHVTGTAEIQSDSAGFSAGGWLGAWWFFLPHFDVRADGILQNVAVGGGQSAFVKSFLAQIHAYL